MKPAALNALALAGYAAVIYGVTLWSVPAAFVIGGTLALSVAELHLYAHAKRRSARP